MKKRRRKNKEEKWFTQTNTEGFIAKKN